MTTLSISLAILLTFALLILLIPLATKNKRNKGRLTKLTFITIALFVPIFSMTGYFILGTPGFAEQTTQQDAPAVITLVDKLEKKLEKNPNDVNGWLLLGRSLMVSEDYDKAIIAFEKAMALEPNNLAAILPLTDALAVKQAGNLSGRPLQLLHKAYQIDPDNQMTLWLLSLAEKQLGNMEKAKKYLQRLYPLLHDQPEDQKSIAKLLKSLGEPIDDTDSSSETQLTVENEQQIQNNQQNSDQQITLNLEIDNEIQKKINNANVFIYVKQPQGMPMPIAAKRYQGNKLPKKIILTKADELMPSRTLNQFPELVIGVKISQGDASSSELLFQKELKIPNPSSTNLIIKF